jgi:hypothetical protein
MKDGDKLRMSFLRLCITSIILNLTKIIEGLQEMVVIIEENMNENDGGES